MNYIFYIGLVVVLMILYTIPATIISLVIALAERTIKKEGKLFYLGRLVRTYLYSSVLLKFADFYITSGLSAILIIAISYFGLMFWWMIETKGAMENYYKNIEFQLAVDKYKIVWFIYTTTFFLMYFANIPIEPFLSKLIFKLTFSLTDYKIFVIIVIVIGLGLLFTYGTKAIGFLISRRGREKNEA